MDIITDYEQPDKDRFVISKQHPTEYKMSPTTPILIKITLKLSIKSVAFFDVNE